MCLGGGELTWWRHENVKGQASIGCRVRVPGCGRNNVIVVAVVVWPWNGRYVSWIASQGHFIRP